MADIFDFETFKEGIEEDNYWEQKEKAYYGAKDNLAHVIDMLEPLYIECDETGESVQKHARTCLLELAFLTREFIQYMCQHFEFDKNEILEQARKAKSLEDILEELEGEQKNG